MDLCFSFLSHKIVPSLHAPVSCDSCNSPFLRFVALKETSHQTYFIYNHHLEPLDETDLVQGTIGCPPNSVPIVFIVFSRDSWGLSPIKTNYIGLM